MTQFINKADLLAEIDKLIDKGKYHEEYDCAHRDGNNDALYTLKWKINNLEVKEIDENAVPILPYSLDETIKCETEKPNNSHCESKYRCGSEPRFKVGDVVFCLESYSTYEDEYEYGIVTKVELDKDDWVYTFDYYGLSTVRSESDLVSDEAYTK